MRNAINILAPVIIGNRIEYKYEVTGEWKEAFNLEESFFIEYSRDISCISQSTAIVPFICNILPIAWVYDAEIHAERCDKAFYESISEFKKGYFDMYPHMDFKGSFNVDILEKNSYNGEGTAAFFSGGVDAFNTLVKHSEEKPLLMTIWGADVKLNDTEGWSNIEKHLKSTAEKFGVEYITIKSKFRSFTKESVLSAKVREISGDNWWHGFQHGIGVIGHAAPVCSAMNKKIVYFASTFTASEKGKITCASSPAIDNFVKFGSTHVVHDGYEFDRQDKVHNITEFAERTGINIPLRVCWRSTGGKNCCKCEKCWRTILEIIAEGKNAQDYDFKYTQSDLKNFHKLFYDKRNILSHVINVYYSKTQQIMRKNLKCSDLPKELQWFYNTDVYKLCNHPFRQGFNKCLAKAKRVIRKFVK